jgi:ABC-2 type transport system permease protein
VLSAAAMFGLGMVIASLAKSEQSALIIANLIYFPMIFLTGATVPLEIMPDVMRRISEALPLTYAVDALKWAWNGGGDVPALALGVLAGTLVVSGAFAAWLFRWE